ncbi:MAG: thiamine diphosphokinase [Clostridia bacterium]|jgi:thiamine pyrophosphokinase|nr:thiamine diphosphokinase [Oscillospiraceae bacterium]MBQ3326463.1 thiamine diphosphokinase [Clostridia bacterium]MBQ6785326.1 thiamine diphosphokinase [Clostridia bacterium]
MNQTDRTCLIVTSRVDGAEQLNIDLSAYDAVICADRGLQVAEALDLLGDVPVYLIGDYDSGTPPTEAEQAAASGLVVLPTVKDMTDSEAAIDLAVSRGYDVIHVLGGLGGRFDHSMGNLGMLAKYVEDPRVKELWFEDGQNRVFMKTPGTFRVPARGPENRFDYFGLIAYSGAVEGLTITGAKYPLAGHTLTPDTTLGVSNEVAKDAPFAEVSHTKGHLLVILSKD